MRWIKAADSVVQSLVGWITFVGLLLTVTYWYAGQFSSLFEGLSWGDQILLAAGLALATIFATAVIVAIAAWAFRRIRPFPAGVDGRALYEDLQRTKERLNRVEERLDGAQVVSAIGF